MTGCVWSSAGMATQQKHRLRPHWRSARPCGPRRLALQPGPRGLGCIPLCIPAVPKRRLGHPRVGCNRLAPRPASEGTPSQPASGVGAAPGSVLLQVATSASPASWLTAVVQPQHEGISSRQRLQAAAQVCRDSTPASASLLPRRMVHMLEMATGCRLHQHQHEPAQDCRRATSVKAVAPCHRCCIEVLPVKAGCP